MAVTCNGYDTWEPNYYKNYIGGSKIYQLDRANNTTYVVELFEVYPKTITAQDLGYAQADAYHTVSVELMFHHWEWSDEATDPVSYTHLTLPTTPYV